MSCNPEVNKKIMKIQQSLVKFKKPCSEWRWWCWFWWELLECSQDGFSFWVISRLYLFIRCCCLAHPSQLFLLTFCARVGWGRRGRSDQSQQKSLLNLSFPPCAGWWGSQFTLPVVTQCAAKLNGEAITAQTKLWTQDSDDAQDACKLVPMLRFCPNNHLTSHV